MPEDQSPSDTWFHEPSEEDIRTLQVPTAAPTSLGVSKTLTLRAILKNLRDSADAALCILDDGTMPADTSRDGLVQSDRAQIPFLTESISTASLAGDRVTEGVFDGEQMVGADGKLYSIPPNYASKSKLVEGDLMKLTIGQRGNFIFKQIGPIERQRIIGTLAYDQDAGQNFVLAAGRSWLVLKASVSYFKGEVADEVVILVPKNAPSKWAAIENIIKKIPQIL